MLRAYRELAEGFAEAILDQDYEAASERFAPWLQREVSPDDLEDRVQGAIDEVSEIIGLTGSAHPRAFRLTEGDLTLGELRAPRPFEPQRRIALEVTEANYRRWIRVQFAPGAGEEMEIEAWFDLWLLVVEYEDGLRIGYFEITDAE